MATDSTQSGTNQKAKRDGKSNNKRKQNTSQRSMHEYTTRPRKRQNHNHTTRAQEDDAPKQQSNLEVEAKAVTTRANYQERDGPLTWRSLYCTASLLIQTLTYRSAYMRSAYASGGASSFSRQWHRRHPCSLGPLTTTAATRRSPTPPRPARSDCSSAASR